MVKFIFLAIMLVNIVFFLWQLRIGAPGIYLPPNYEKRIAHSAGRQKIILLSEMPELSLEDSALIQQAETATDKTVVIEKLVTTTEPPAFLAKNETESKIITDNDFPQHLDQSSISPANSPKNSKYPILACYQLKVGDYTQDMFAPKNKKNGFRLALFEQETQNISSYLVLTQKYESYQEAKKMEQEIKQQGIDNLWLFRQGLFINRISLGLFSTEEQANKAKELYSKQTAPTLEVVPSYKTILTTHIKISTLDRLQLTIFEQEFSKVIAEKIECNRENSTGFQRGQLE